MERTIRTHVVDSHSPLRVTAHGLPNAGGAINRYIVSTDGSGNYAVLGDIRFQAGAPAAHGTNGVTIEALLAICIDRLAGLQYGPFPCFENAAALAHLSAGLEELHNRTRRLLAGGACDVRGTLHTVTHVDGDLSA